MSTEEIIRYSITTGAILFSLSSVFIIFLIVFLNLKVYRYHLEKKEIENNKQDELLNATFVAQEQERQRIGSDIHDDIGPLLSTIKLYLNKFRYTKSKEEVESEIKSLNSQLDEIVQRIRIVAKDLVPVVLIEFGLISALEDLCSRINKSRSIRAELTSNIDELNLDDKTRLALYRIIQELCNNTMKHAEADFLSIEIDRIDQQLNITIMDNGKGFEPSKEFSGLGLRNIKARVSLIEAMFNIKSYPKKGTIASIALDVGTA